MLANASLMLTIVLTRKPSVCTEINKWLNFHFEWTIILNTDDEKHIFSSVMYIKKKLSANGVNLTA